MPTTILPDALLACGIAAALLFVVMNVLAGSLWGVLQTGRRYDYISQSIDELSAIGSPTRALASALSILYGLLLTAFGIGAWLLGHGNPALRICAALVIACALLGLLAAIFLPMRIGDAAGAPVNARRVIAMATGLLCMLLAMVAGAVAFDNWFRIYSLATLALFAVLTVLGIFVLPRLAPGPAVRIGIQERTMMFFILLWVVLLALALWRGPAPE